MHILAAQPQKQQNQAAQLAHTDALCTLAVSVQKIFFDQIFSSIPLFGGMKKDDMFEWIERLEPTCLQSVHDIDNKVLGKGEVTSVHALWGYL